MNYLPELPDDWKQALEPFYDFSGLAAIDDFLEAERGRAQIFPPAELTFAALEATPFEQVKVLLLGQDPYHDDGQACGLAFSVGDEVPAPPSLKNILKEYSSDLALPMPVTHSLRTWAGRGVLLLNTVLTVRAHQAGAHQGKGWEIFTDAVIRALNARKTPLVFILWGNPAQKKQPLITSPQHAVIASPHPSPLSAYRGFFGSRPFSAASLLLEQRGCQPVDWKLD